MNTRLPPLHTSISCEVEPGTLFLLEQGEAWGATMFRAVLACPGCGTLVLVTQAQYTGDTPIICCAERCCAEYTLDNKQIRFRAAQ